MNDNMPIRVVDCLWISCPANWSKAHAPLTPIFHFENSECNIKCVSFWFLTLPCKLQLLFVKSKRSHRTMNKLITQDKCLLFISAGINTVGEFVTRVTKSGSGSACWFFDLLRFDFIVNILNAIKSNASPSETILTLTCTA